MLRPSFVLFCVSIKVLAQFNTNYDEQAPMLTPDGTEMYFTVSNHPLNAGGSDDKGDIWVSQWKDNRWSAPMLPKGSINNAAYNVVLGFSSDGKKMFLLGQYNYYGEATGSQGIAVSRRTGGIWTNPHNETIPLLPNLGVVTSGYIDPNKSVFIFSVKTPADNNEDLFVSFHVDGKWTSPKSLGTIINTKNDERTPWFSADLKTLFFSANALTSVGGFDVFSSQRLDDSWLNWSEPKNLGAPINTVDSELFYRASPTNAWYTSTFKSVGHSDIMEYKLPHQEIVQSKKDSILERPIEAQAAAPVAMPDNNNGLAKIYGRITNARTGAVVPASIVFFRPQPPVVFVLANKQDGYKAELHDKSTYVVQIESPGYINYTGKIDLTQENLQQLEFNFKLEPLPVGTSVSLRNILFRQSTAEMLPESYDELNMVVDFLVTNPTVEIELSGHTDDAGPAKLNLKLSRDRVARVKHYITSKGIAASRIAGVGYGERSPVASNETEAGKRQNRRVEFKIVKE